MNKNKRGIRVYHWRWYGRHIAYTRHVDFLKRWVREKNTIQIGAQDGLIVGKLGIHGIDNNLYAIKLAKSNGVKIDYSNSRRLPYINGQFDSALVADSIQSYRNFTLALSEIRRVIKNHLYVSVWATTPNSIKPKDLATKVEKRGFDLVGNPIYKSDRKRYYFKFQKA